MLRIPLILTLLALLPASAIAQSTWYVPDDFPTIQTGIDGSSNGDTVIVRDGTYVENINFNGKAITLKSEYGPATTIIDGNQAGSVVTFSSFEGPDSVLDGFTVTKGLADLGGGLSCGVDSSPTLTNCTFTGNTAGKDGGGMYCVDASPALDNCTFTGNSTRWGGGMYCRDDSSPTLENCTFTNNTATDHGGGMYYSDSSPTLDNCTFTNNTATLYGGGMYYWDSSPALDNCTFTGNTSTRGGGIYLVGSTAIIQGCLFDLNEASIYGAGIYSTNSHVSLFETTIVRNENTSGEYGSSFFSDNHSSLMARNIITWDNSPWQAHGLWIGTYSTADFDYSLISEEINTNPGNDRGTWIIGDHMLGTLGNAPDPLFADPTNGDFHLQATSPCIDTGDPNSALDPDGTIADMGAFYFNQDDDMDNDGLLDADEIAIYGTNPQLFDTDGDGLGDGQELGMTNATVTADTDLSIFKEDSDPSTMTNPLNADSDGGGINDGHEDQDKNGAFSAWETDPNDSVDDDLAMYVYELEPGNNVIFRVRNGTPNALIIPCYSLNGQGPTDVGIGIPMSLSPPISQLQAFRLGFGGYGEVTSARVPLSAPIGLPVYFQGVEILITPGQSIRLTNAILKPITENN